MKEEAKEISKIRKERDDTKLGTKPKRNRSTSRSDFSEDENLERKYRQKSRREDSRHDKRRTNSYDQRRERKDDKRKEEYVIRDWRWSYGTGRKEDNRGSNEQRKRSGSPYSSYRHNNRRAPSRESERE